MMRFLEFAAHFLSGGLIYLFTCGILAAGMHFFMRDYIRACVWAVVGSVASIVIIVLVSGVRVDSVGYFIIFAIFLPSFVIISAVIGLPFLLARRARGKDRGLPTQEMM